MPSTHAAPRWPFVRASRMPSPNPVAPFAIPLLALVLSACSGNDDQEGPQGLPTDGDPASDGSGAADPTSTGTALDGGSGDVEPLRCQDDEVQCADECADLRWSEDHCGECGHACTVVDGVGQCWEGTCPPTGYCALAEQDLTTCQAVCESYGETCVDTEPKVRGSCGGEWYGLRYGVTDAFDCDSGFASSTAVPGGCTDPIRWDLPGGPSGDALPGAVVCCCTQP